MGSIALDQVAFLDDWEFHPEKSEPTTPRPDTTIRSRGPDMSKSCLALACGWQVMCLEIEPKCGANGCLGNTVNDTI